MFQIILYAIATFSCTLSFSPLILTPRCHRVNFSHASGCIEAQHTKLSPKLQASAKDEEESKDNSSENSKNDYKQTDGGEVKNIDDKARKRTQIAKAAKQLIKRTEKEEGNWLNPFQAGQNLRKSLDSALTSFARASGSAESRQKSLYYLDDRFQESGGALFTQETNPYLSRLEKDAYIPEVLVVGATGEVGRLVVRRLLLEGRSRVRVLVRNLFSKTLNMLGTGVTYCQGDLNNMDSLEYALTDVDKIVMCAAAPRPDEKGFQKKFLGFAEDNLKNEDSVLKNIESSKYKRGATEEEITETDIEWERLQSVVEVRARLAEQVDFIGMQNLVKAYQNVRHADYGTSQAAKRSLFKFQDRPEDFNLFAVDDDDDAVALLGRTGALEDRTDESENTPQATMKTSTVSTATKSKKTITEGVYSESFDQTYDEYADEYDKYDNSYDDDDDAYADYGSDLSSSNSDLVENRQGTTVQSQIKWIRNEFGHGVFVGKVPKSTANRVGGEASIISSRLRSREGGPDDGIDLSGGFGGFVCRVCADGGNYEAFIRGAAYEEVGIEYVCEFSTSSKPTRRGNASRNKFITVRLPFQAFKPVRRRTSAAGNVDQEIPQFRGSDVRHLGFRYRSSSNSNALRSKLEEGEMSSFYLALSYIKLYRTQPEPEFVFLSDARIPPLLLDGQVRHDLRQLLPAEALSGSGSGGVQLLDEKALKQVTADKMGRSPEETYFKLRGEEILKNSGLR
jgi:hypothetical protein